MHERLFVWVMPSLSVIHAVFNPCKDCKGHVSDTQQKIPKTNVIDESDRARSPSEDAGDPTRLEGKSTHSRTHKYMSAMTALLAFVS